MSRITEVARKHFASDPGSFPKKNHSRELKQQEIV